MKPLTFYNNISMRPAKPVDDVFIEALFESTREALKWGDNDPDYVKMVIENQHYLQSKSYSTNYPEAMIFIIEYHHQKVGRAIVDFGHNVAHLIDLAFIAPARGKGYGKIVIQALQQAAAKTHLPMTLVVDQENTIATKLYLSLGFRVESVKPPSVLMVWYPESKVMS